MAGEALQPTETATTVRVRNGKVSTTDGPFAETKEQLGGFYLIEAKDLNEAIQVAARIPVGADRRDRGPAGGGFLPGRRPSSEPAASTASEADASRRDVALRSACDDRLPLANLAPRSRHPHPPPRRLRSGRGGAAGRLRGGGGALAGGGGAGQPARLAGLHRPLQGDRRAAPAGPVRRLAGGVADRLERRRHASADELDDEGVEDDRLRLIFTCCHPALPPDAQIALTLREVCGLTTEEIARAFLSPRADAGAADRAGQGQDSRRRGFPTRCRRGPTCPSGSTTVLHVIYLVFNEGYSASSGDVAHPARSLGRGDPAGPAAGGAAAGARGAGAAGADAAARVAARGAHVGRRRAGAAGRAGPVALESGADRGGNGAGASGRWRRARFGPYTSGGDRGGARRGAERGRRPTGPRSWGCTMCCMRADPSPVVELNRAAAVAMRDGPEAGLALIDAILARGELADYPLAHSARAELCRRLGRTAEAIAAYQRALELTGQEPQRRFLERRLGELSAGGLLLP